MKMKITIPHQNYGLIELYDTIAMEMGCPNVGDLEYDCRKVNIAKNIQDGIYDHYMELGEAQKAHESDIHLSITMLLACSGPKVDENLADDEVEVFDGFIC